MDGIARASSVLPLPGGPVISILWPPAAATSSARLACSCPRTSARSTYRPARASVPLSAATPFIPDASSDTGAIRLLSCRCRISCPSASTGNTSTPCTSAASPASHAGANTDLMPSSRATATIGSTPFVWRNLPSSESSPSITVDSGAAGSCPDAISSATAIGRSYAGPALGRSAGAIFTVMRRIGNSQPELRIAARTRSRASCTAVSGNPTMLKRGKPGDMSTSI